MTHLRSRKMTGIENTIWRAPTTVLVCVSIIHAEGVLSKEMNKFRLRSLAIDPFVRGLARGKSLYQFLFDWSLLASKPWSFLVSAEGILRRSFEFKDAEG